MALYLYNTLSRTKEEFVPLNPELIRMYVCGPTVYSHSHIGHAKSYISFDVIRRYLMHAYGKERLLYVMNITDVGHLVSDADEGEDKVEVQARRENRTPYEIAGAYEESFWEDFGRMNMLKPDRVPHATDFIRQQIQMVESLIEKGLAYQANGSVYFDVAAYEQYEKCGECIPYGGLSNRQTEEQTGGGRIASNPEKRAPQDFALWKRAEENHFMQWHSPWGWGFPGWHLECSVMSQHYLGATFDIHGGGLENQFPHHECEIAQSQGANGAPFVKYWLHNNILTHGGKKMGKSMGNASNLKDLFSKYDPIALRFFILQSHYRSPLEFDEGAIQAAETGLGKLRNTMQRLREKTGDVPASAGSEELPCMKSFLTAMNDDINTPVAIGALFEGVSEANKLLAAEGASDTALLAQYQAAFAVAFDDILGLELFAASGNTGDGELTDGLMQLMITLRAEARARKDFATSDEIRDKLKEIGVVLEDSKEGTRWVRE